MRALPALVLPTEIVTVTVDLECAKRQEETVRLLREFLARATLAKLADLSLEDKPDDSGSVAGH